MKTRHITTKSAAEAWREADKLFPCDYLHDSSRSARAGYGIYMSTNPEIYAWISDLGDRLEINLSDGSTVNVWIEPEDEEEAEEIERRADDTAAEKASKERAESIAAKYSGEFSSLVHAITGERYIPADSAEAVALDRIARANAKAKAKIEEAEEKEPEAVSAEESSAAVEAIEAAQRFTADAISAEVCQRVTVVINSGVLARCDDEQKIYNALLKNAPLEHDILTKFAESSGLRWGCIRCESVKHYKHGNTENGHFCITGTISARVGEELSFLASCADILSAEHDNNRK